jgi:8-oxo-dGTP diphosphatase
LAFRCVHVAAGVLLDEAGRVLVAQRPAGKSMAGAWEFPGGKLVPGETRFAGLARELQEELGIYVESARPLIRFRHAYPELEVDLDVWHVSRWRGEPMGRDGQELAWRDAGKLREIGLLPADVPIVNAICLPPMILVTPPRTSRGEEAFLDALETHKPLQSLVCLRRPGLGGTALLEFAAGAVCRLEGTGTRLLLHGDPVELAPLLIEPPAKLRARLGDTLAGLHIPARYLPRLSGRPVPESLWFGVSCHGAEELMAAQAAGANYAFLGPIKETASHPGRPGMGWSAFEALVRDLALPVYAIGGLGPEDLATAWTHGAQGIAAIRSLWPG